MKEYNKEKLHEYAKELFALCLEKGINLVFGNNRFEIHANLGNGKKYYYTYINYEYYNNKDSWSMPIWELIEKVKQS